MATVGTAFLGRRQREGEPFLGRLMALVMFLLLLAALFPHDDSLHALADQLPVLMVWVLLVLVMNLLPVTVNDVQLTLDLPLLLAVAMLYGAESAAVVGFVATVDSRQVSGHGVSVWRSLFNRSQVALSTWTAGAVFSLLAPGILPLTLSVPALCAAVLADYLLNTAAVAAHVAVTRGIGLRQSARQLVEPPAHFVATYLGYAALSLILAMLHVRVGIWSVVAFLLPLAGARQLLLKGQALERLAVDLRQHDKLLGQALDQLEVERTNERMRIAGDLHDDVLQSFIHVRMLGRLLEKSLEPQPKGELKEVAEIACEVRESADSAIEGLRRVITGLSASELESYGLIGTLQRLLDRLQRDWRVEIRAVLPEESHLGSELDLVIYQTTREAVLNAIKHSGAVRIDVCLCLSDTEAIVDVQDDGVGFAPITVPGNSGQGFGLGLLRSRVESISGTVAVDSSPGKGTRLRASLPLTEGSEARSQCRSQDLNG